jgi:hypothetical protein
VAGFDSSGAMLRALARFLHGQDFPALGNPRALAPLLIAGNLLPARLRERVYAASGGLTAVPAERLSRPFAEDVAAWTTSLYPRRRSPLALIGSSNGATTVRRGDLTTKQHHSTETFSAGRRALPAGPAEPTVDGTVGARLQAAYTQPRPDGQTWTARTLAEAAGCGRSSAAAFLQRHRPSTAEDAW